MKKLNQKNKSLMCTSVFVGLLLSGNTTWAEEKSLHGNGSPVKQGNTADSRTEWAAVTLPPAADVELSGQVGEALARGIARMGNPPSNPHYSLPYVRADVSFEMDRKYTNYSGDISGRYLELCSLTSPPGVIAPPVLEPLMKTITQYQKEDGHFGAPINLADPLKLNVNPAIALMWGNARLLIGLVTASERFHSPELMASARRLGDWYINTADRYCNIAHEKDYRSSGNYAGYQTCYFPAVESLAKLYVATKDERYLKMAEQIAALFMDSFDCLPVGHAHGNLCAWRGILNLYQITGKKDYLTRSIAKWDAVVTGNYLWPLGGMSEGFKVFHKNDEGCALADWLRFSLELWRFTGETRYLDFAERLLHNQYAANQNRSTGGWGGNSYEGDEKVGPDTLVGQAGEFGVCCSFHGTLSLYFLKQYLAGADKQNVYVNFPFSFKAPIKTAAQDWILDVKSAPNFLEGHTHVEIGLAPQGKSSAEPCFLHVRMPNWATGAKIADAEGKQIAAHIERGYLRIDRPVKAGEKLTVDFENTLILEGRRFEKASVPDPKGTKAGEVAVVRDVAVVAGPDNLFAMGIWTPGRPVLLATRDAKGQLSFPTTGDGQFVTVVLPNTDVTQAQIEEALRSGTRTVLRSWSGIMASWKKPLTIKLASAPPTPPDGKVPRLRLPFMFDLVVVPASSLPNAAAMLGTQLK